MRNRFLFTTAMLILVAGAAFAQERQETTDVEVEPITCWWRTTANAVRMGEPFGLTLTCSVVEAEAMKVVPDLSRLDPTVVQLPPFEILGGTHPGDITRPGFRFLQYTYRLRLLSEELFGADVSLPPLEITYRIESKVSSGDTVQGRDLTYLLPRQSIRVISLVPNDATDIRESGAVGFADIESRVSRGTLMQTVATLLVAIAGFVGLVMLVGVVKRRTAGVTLVQHHLPARDLIAAAIRELTDVQRESRGGWTPELAGRALAAIRIGGSYATGRAVGQVPAADKGEPVEGQIALGGGLGKARVFASGSVTPQSAGDVPGLADALKSLTLARYGREQKAGSDADDAVEAGLRILKQQASKHSRLAEWTAAAIASVTDLRKKVWA